MLVYEVRRGEAALISLENSPGDLDRFVAAAVVVAVVLENSSSSTGFAPSPSDEGCPFSASRRPPLPPLHSRICFSVLTRRSSTLWLRIADTSMYLLLYDFANDLPSATRHSSHTHIHNFPVSLDFLCSYYHYYSIVTDPEG